MKKWKMLILCVVLVGILSGCEIKFGQMNYAPEQYAVLMRETGLFELLENHLVSNLIDYALGVEVGLNSNGRKNRGGHLMEDLVESFIKKGRFILSLRAFNFTLASLSLSITILYRVQAT